jgi:hypothetical protein
MASTEIILAIANVVFIIIAIFLFVRLRKMGKKVGTEKKQQSELAGITDITPEEFKPERFELKVQDIAQPEKTTATASDIFAESKIGVQEKTEFKLEDVFPEVKEKPRKKESKRRKTAKKEPGEVVAPSIKEVVVPSENITVPEKSELKLEDILSRKEEKPEKKERKKKRPAKKRKVAPQEEPLIKTESVKETINEEKTARKKRKTVI